MIRVAGVAAALAVLVACGAPGTSTPPSPRQLPADRTWISDGLRGERTATGPAYRVVCRTKDGRWWQEIRVPLASAEARPEQYAAGQPCPSGPVIVGPDYVGD